MQKHLAFSSDDAIIEGYKCEASLSEENYFLEDSLNQRQGFCPLKVLPSKFDFDDDFAYGWNAFYEHVT